MVALVRMIPKALGRPTSRARSASKHWSFLQMNGVIT
jgi:hypothetical protein